MRHAAATLAKALLLLGATALMQPVLAQAKAQAQSPAEGHRRAAAAVLATQGTLALLVAECGPLLPDAAGGPQAVSRAWHERNRKLLEAAVAWTDQDLTRAAGGDPAAFSRASGELLAAAHLAVRGNAVALFQRQPPTPATCRAALAPYAARERDLAPPPQVKVPREQRAFAAMLERLRAQSGLRLPQRLQRMVDPGPEFGLLASAEAAAAARERGDGAAAAQIYLGMANRRDAGAAQALGVMYLEGKLLPPAPLNAYRWFYIAWTLGDQEGLNALGAMLRDGVAVQRNPRLAFAAFSLAAARSRMAETRARAAGNAQEVRDTLPNPERLEAACLTLDRFNAELVKPLASAELLRDRRLAGGDRRLGDLAPAMVAGLNMICL